MGNYTEDCFTTYSGNIRSLDYSSHGAGRP